MKKAVCIRFAGSGERPVVVQVSVAYCGGFKGTKKRRGVTQ